MPIRITGLNSGLDTESIISALVSSYNYKTNKFKKAQTKLSWKQDAWQALNTKIYSLYNNVFNMRFSSAYNMKTTKVSDPTKATVKASSNAVNGTQKLNIIKTAQAGYLTGGKLDGNVTTGTTLAELGYTGGNGKIKVTKGDGTSTDIEVSQGTTVNDFLKSLQKAGVNASFDSTNKRLYVSSKETGKNNDFSLTGSNVDGASALTKLGLNVNSAATQATYSSYAKYYYDGYDITAGVASGNITQNVKDAIAAYEQAKESYEHAAAQNKNLTGAYGYAAAYAAMKDTLNATGLSAADQDKFRTLLGMTASQRVNSLMDDNGNIYTQKTKDEDGNAIFSYKDASGTERLVQREVTYKGSDNNTYTLNKDKTYTDSNGNIFKATKEKDADGNTIYINKAADGTETKVSIKSETSYYEVNAVEKPTGMTKYVDAAGNEYLPNDTGTYLGKDGKEYTLEANGNLKDADGNEITVTGEPITETVYERTTGTALTDIGRATDEYNRIKEASGLKDEDISKLASNVATVNTYEKSTDTLDATDPYNKADIITSIQNAYAAGGAAGTSNVTNNYATIITNNKAVMEADSKVMEEHSNLAKIAAMQDGPDKDAAIASFVSQVTAAKDILNSTDYNADAKKIDGQDAVIKLNGVEYTGSSNSFSINGLTITAENVTGDGDDNAITITTATDVQGIYDKVKDFLTQYNALINEMTSLYNAENAKGYEPLTDEERDAMSDTEIEKWEAKIKGSLLRRDDTLSGLISTMTGAMSKTVELNGKKYNLSSFGIKTLGYLNAPENQHYAYHIDGDEDDANTAGNADKLMAAITEDPDSVIDFMKQLSTNLYDAVDKKMKSSSLSSIYKVYNDKEMASEYSNYTSTIKKWEQKLQEKEDYYYKKFAAMETALAKLNSSSSALSGLFGA